MKTNQKTIASILAISIWADGSFEDAEKVAVSEVAEALGFDETEFVNTVNAAWEEIKEKDEDAVNMYLEEIAQKVAPSENKVLFEVALEIVLSDGVLAKSEVSVLMAIASALNVDEEDAILMIADMVKEEPDIEVEF